MITLLIAASGATGVPDRETADADFGVPFSVVRDPWLLDELRQRGYTDLDGSRPDAWRYMVEVQDPGKPADVTGYR